LLGATARQRAKTFDACRQSLRRRQLFSGDDTRGFCTKLRGGVDPPADPVAVAGMLGWMRDVAIVDQKRRERDIRVLDRAADVAKVGLVAALEMEMAELEMINAALPDRGRQIVSPKVSLPGAFG
jgi:hypothetical protein